jgi:two-component system sensor histidine kinase FlrB
MNVPLEFLKPADDHLSDAFATFIAAANRLEYSHVQLHEEVTRLRTELEERNRALASSVEENERTRQLLHEILDTLPCGVTVLDPEVKQITLLNPASRLLLDIAPRKTAEWQDIPAVLRNMLSHPSVEALKADEEREFSIEGADGKRWLAARPSAMEARESGSKNIILTLQDITARKLAEQEREASRHMVALAEIATVLAHEIRNPLGSLELLTGLLAGDAGLSSDSKQWVQHLQAGVRSLSATVNNVLRYHSPGEPQFIPIRLSEVLQNGINFVRPLAQQRGVALSLRETLGDLEIAGDAGAIHQVILNLACNAMRYTPPGGQVTLTAARQKKRGRKAVSLDFCDTGAGIKPEHLSKIFEPGFSTTRQSPGLGLTISERIVKQHGGTITVESQPGIGTTFRMEFPIL